MRHVALRHDVGRGAAVAVGGDAAKWSCLSVKCGRGGMCLFKMICEPCFKDSKTVILIYITYMFQAFYSFNLDNYAPPPLIEKYIRLSL